MRSVKGLIMSHPSLPEIKNALESAKTAYSQSTTTTYYLLQALEQFSSEGEAELIGQAAETYAHAKQLSKALELLQFDVAKLFSSVEKANSIAQ